MSEALWSVLGIAPTQDVGAIRRAYAAKLKTCRPDDDREAFQALRSAYEQLLQICKRGAGIATTREATPAPEAAKGAAQAQQSTAQVAISDPQIEQLHQDFRTLHQLLFIEQGELSSAAGDTLRSICNNAALESISVEQRVQHQLADMLATCIPRSDDLLVHAIEHFGWAKPEAEPRLSPAMRGILRRVTDLQFLDQLRSGKNVYSRSFRNLQRRPIPVLTWLRVHLPKSKQTPSDYQLLQIFRMHHPGLMPQLEPKMVEWWDRLASRPQISMPIIYVFAVLWILQLLIVGSTEGFAVTLRQSMSFVGIAAGVTLWKYLLLDWPRYWIRRRWPVQPIWLQSSWLAISLAVCALNTLLPYSKPLFAIALLTGVLAAQWAWIVGEPGRSRARNDELLSLPPVRVTIHGGLLFVIWWAAVLRDVETADHLRAASITAMVASGLGLPALCRAWELDLNAQHRRIFLAGVACLAALSCAAFWFLTDQHWRPLLATLALAVIMLHRPFAMVMGQDQQKFRFGWMVGGFFVLLATQILEIDLHGRDLVVVGGGMVLMSTVMVCAAIAAWNEHRGLIAPYHESPLFDG